MSMSTGSKKDGPVSEINVTPLVDIMLVLLIIMMLIAPLLMLHSVAERDAGAAMGEDECLGSAPDVIPACVAGIQEFWRHYRKRSANRSRRHARPRSRASSV